MTLPFASTLVQVARADTVGKDPDDPDYPDPTLVQSGLRATIGMVSGSATEAGGTRVVYSATMVTDPADLRANDTVTDAGGTAWRLLWARRSGAAGMDVMECRVQLVEGAD